MKNFFPETVSFIHLYNIFAVNLKMCNNYIIIHAPGIGIYLNKFYEKNHKSIYKFEYKKPI